MEVVTRWGQIAGRWFYLGTLKREKRDFRQLEHLHWEMYEVRCTKYEY
jgi:hypothetical protein